MARDLTTFFLPEPAPRTVEYTVVSVDDHVVEPPHAFESRVPARFRELAPQLRTYDDGSQCWEFDGRTFPQVGLNAFAGRRPETFDREPARFDQMRPGCYDINERVRDMDINGVWASLNFPSQVAGFSGRVFATASDPELGLSVTRAWNDWLFEEWFTPYPERIIPNGITFLADADAAAAEIRRNAARGFRSVSLPERPHRIGLPSIFDPWWDPIIKACVDTDTVVSLHVGSSGMLDHAPGAPDVEMTASLFTSMSLLACNEWLWSPYPRRFPELRIAMSEGGIGWVAMLHERLNKITTRYARDWVVSPSDVLRRNFWFCTIDELVTAEMVERIGLDRILLEVDYPHIDGTWPDTQAAVEHTLGRLPAPAIRAICCENAARLYRHPLPADVLPR